MRKIWLLRLCSNIFTNWLIIRLGLENKIKYKIMFWQKFTPNESKSTQENAGYSHGEKVQQTVDETHVVMKAHVAEHLPNGGAVLDIGCGPGLYLQDFENRENSDAYSLMGLDISSEMIKLAESNTSKVKLQVADFMLHDFGTQKFDFIYMIGALQYISRSDIKKFFAKIADLLNEKGCLMISYPHAIGYKDLMYSHIAYIQYSPKFLNGALGARYNVLSHSHTTRKDFVGKYDKTPYNDPNSNFDKSYVNSSIFIAQRK
jgi:cyclopropane fatty-acyl-phospholipid synthase-like methyltransferase